MVGMMWLYNASGVDSCGLVSFQVFKLKNLQKAFVFLPEQTDGLMGQAVDNQKYLCIVKQEKNIHKIVKNSFNREFVKM